MSASPFSPEVTVLIVEDSESDLEMYERALKLDAECSYKILSTCNKREALDLYQTHQPDCLLLDYNLPGFTGLDLLNSLYEHYPENQIVAVMLTGGGSEDLAREALKSGVKEYLPKRDVSSDSLRITIHNVIRRAELEENAKQHELQLEAALKKAEEVAHVKGEFLANMSHEIRTPLTAIIGFAEVGLGEQSNESERENAIQAILRNGKHLLALVNDILDFSKIGAGKLEVESAKCSVAEVLHDIDIIMRPVANEKTLDFHIEANEPLPEYIMSDLTPHKTDFVKSY